jgi:hypothetical protein
MQPNESWDAEIRRNLQEIVDPLCRDIMCGRIDSWEAQQRWTEVRKQLAICVPGQIDLVDRIYGSRVNRLIEQFCIPREVEDLIGGLDDSGPDAGNEPGI